MKPILIFLSLLSIAPAQSVDTNTVPDYVNRVFRLEINALPRLRYLVSPTNAQTKVPPPKVVPPYAPLGGFNRGNFKMDTNLANDATLLRGFFTQKGIDLSPPAFSCYYSFGHQSLSIHCRRSDLEKIEKALAELNPQK